MAAAPVAKFRIALLVAQIFPSTANAASAKEQPAEDMLL